MLFYKCMLLLKKIGGKNMYHQLKIMSLLFWLYSWAVHENRWLNWTARDLISSIINTILKIKTSLKIKTKKK